MKDSGIKSCPEEELLKLRIGACCELTNLVSTDDIPSIGMVLLYLLDAAEIFIVNIDTIFSKSALRRYLCADCLHAWLELRTNLFVELCLGENCSDTIRKICNAISSDVLCVIELFLFGEQINLHRRICTI